MKSAEILRIHSVVNQGAQVVMQAVVSFADRKLISDCTISTLWPSEEQAQMVALAITLSVGLEETFERLGKSLNEERPSGCPLRQADAKKRFLQ